jgi:hypothetical protein
VSARTIALILAGAVGIYLVFTAGRAWVLILSGDPVPVALGLSIMVIPLIGAWMVGRELIFGLRSQEVGRALARIGGLPQDDLPRTPSGRVERDAADERFLERQAEVEANPRDWGAWYRLAMAYDDARDRRRARAAMRTAIRVFRESGDAVDPVGGID